MAVNRQDYLEILERSASRVPYWARSTNPIVRRHLGLNWRTVPPEIRPIITGYLIWAGIFLVGIVFPVVQMSAAILVISSILIMPVVGLLYLHILFHIAIKTADTMQEELRNNTLPLLRATPMSLEQIFLGKIAVSIWKRMDDLMMVVQAVLVFIPPLLMSAYTGYWSLQSDPGIAQLIIMIGLLVFLLRAVVEPMMIGALAVLVGVIVPNRNTAIVATVAFSVVYFALTFMFSRLPMIRGDKLADGTLLTPDVNLIVLVDFVLPVLVPAILTYLMLKTAARRVTAD
jgi:hypothetical protein